MVLCMIFAHVFWTRWFSVHGIGHDGFQSMVLDSFVGNNIERWGGESVLSH